MLLRVRVTLPDRPGALGQVARTLGVAGADIVQVVVLERLSGRAVDDFTVVWPGAARVERLLAGLAAIPGVQVDGVWRAIGAPVSGGHDAELLAQVAANPADGLATLVDAVPGLLAADWAVAAVVPSDWAARSGAGPRSAGPVPQLSGPAASQPPGPLSHLPGPVSHLPVPHLPISPQPGAVPRAETTVGADPGADGGQGERRHLRLLPGESVVPLSVDGAPSTRYASWRAPSPLHLPEVTPLRARPLVGPDGTRYAVAPFGRAGLVLVVARGDDEELPAAAFHITEVDRIAQLVRAAAVIIGDRLDRVDGPTVVHPS